MRLLTYFLELKFGSYNMDGDIIFMRKLDLSMDVEKQSPFQQSICFFLTYAKPLTTIDVKILLSVPK